MCLLQNSKKVTKNNISKHNLAKCVPRQVNCTDSIMLHVRQYDSYTQKYHDHLFQKSWQQSCPCVMPQNCEKVTKTDYWKHNLAKYVCSQVKWTDPIIIHVIQYKSNTQKFHDHLFQKPWQQSCPGFLPQNCEKVVKTNVWNHNLAKYGSSLINCTDTIIIHIIQYKSNTQKSHDHLVQKSDQQSCPGFCHKIAKSHENQYLRIQSCLICF